VIRALAAALTPLLLLIPAEAAGAAGQDPSAWNSSEALSLVERGREARGVVERDGELRSYRALTEGHIYFFVDSEEGERALIRVDQVAVELFWEAPDQIRQRVVGERSETRLPVRDFRYYLDRLTLVQYGFGDEIQVGHGLDVAGVPHPLAPLPGGDPDRGRYDFRLADSVALHLAGEPDPITIYRVQVRPRDPAAPGVLGSIYLARRDAQLVRMEITFTPASYVDRRTDRISIELDYGLWEGTYWLPNRQQIEVRRELPELDIGMGTVIRAVLRVGGYELNAPVPPEIRMGPPVTAAPASAREAYEFPEGLFAAIERDGLGDVATRIDPRELRAEAARLLRNRPPTGLSPLRLHIPALSSFVAFDRARGLDVGAGLSFRPAGTLRLRAAGGWSFAPARARTDLTLDGIPAGAWTLAARARWNGREDLGVTPGIAPLLGSAAGAVLGEDYRDPWRVSGADLIASREVGERRRTSLGLGVERHRSETLALEDAPWREGRSFRPVLPVADGTFLRVEGGWIEPVPYLPGWGSGRLELQGSVLTGEAGTGGRMDLEGRGVWSTPTGERELRLGLHAGTRMGDPLPQLHRLAGGRGTLPGFPFRSFAGSHHALAEIEGSSDLGSPLVRLRGGLHTGWLGGGVPEAWERGGTGGVLVGATLGFGFFFDLLRLTGARGLGGGEWQLLFSVDPRWWDRL
jgi:hypothetical protein